MTPELVAQIQGWIDGVDRAAEAAQVSTVVAEVLAGLGYVVQEGFATALAADGRAHARVDDPAWRDHGVRVRLDAGGRQLGFHVVQAEDRTAEHARGAALEAEWCEDVPGLPAAIRVRGVDLDLTAHAAPGELPIASVPRSMLQGGGEVPPVQAEEPDRRHRRRRSRRRPGERER